jgi:hypothetical protein
MIFLYQLILEIKKLLQYMMLTIFLYLLILNIIKKIFFKNFNQAMNKINLNLKHISYCLL